VDHGVHEVIEEMRLVRPRQVLDRHHERRVADDPRLAVDDRGQLRERLEAVLGARLGEVSLEALALLAARFRPELAGDVLDVDAGVPEVEVALRGQLANRLAVGTRDRRVDPLAVGVAEA
jgi:hypothetical protein